MSVYIKITEADLPASTNNKLTLTITGRDSQLNVESLPDHFKPTWNASFISSAKEKALKFVLTDIDSKKQLSQGQLFFSCIRYRPQKQFKQTLILDNNGKIQLQIYFTRRKNYIGSLQFYEFQSWTPHQSNILQASTVSENLPNDKEAISLKRAATLPVDQPVKQNKKGGFFNFFCCGQENLDDKRFQVEDDDIPRGARTPISGLDLQDNLQEEIAQSVQGEPFKAQNPTTITGNTERRQKLNLVSGAGSPNH